MATSDDYRAVKLIKSRDPLCPRPGMATHPSIVAAAMADERERLAKMIELTWPTAAQVIRIRGAE